MATHSSIPAWKIPWTEEPGGLQSMESQRIRHDWVTEHVCMHTHTHTHTHTHMFTHTFHGVHGKPLKYSCCKNPTNSMKRQKDMIPEDKPRPGQKVSNMLSGKSGGLLAIINSSRQNEALGHQSRNDAQLWMCLVVKVKSNAVKNNTAQESGMLNVRSMN